MVDTRLDALLEIGPSRPLRAIARELHERGIATTGGGVLHPQAVARLLDQLGVPRRVEIRQADALTLQLPPSSIDCVVTSPPYSMQRAGHYPSVPEAAYPAWTVEWMRAVRSALKPRGSVLLVIRPHVSQGQLSDYVLRTRLALRDDNWLECDELIWVKPTTLPLGHNRRLRRSWESILWFAQVRNPYCEPHATGKLSARLGMRETRHSNRSEASPKREGLSRGTDVISVKPDGDPLCEHSAQYPVELAANLIKIFSPLGGFVLDPFSGAGTTALAAAQTGRRCIGSDVSARFVRMAQQRLKRNLVDR